MRSIISRSAWSLTLAIVRRQSEQIASQVPSGFLRWEKVRTEDAVIAGTLSVSRLPDAARLHPFHPVVCEKPVVIPPFYRPAAPRVVLHSTYEQLYFPDRAPVVAKWEIASVLPFPSYFSVVGEFSTAP